MLASESWQIAPAVQLFPGGNDPSDKTRDPAARLGDPTGADFLTVLVVDDDLANLALAQAVLEAEGYRVHLATDGETMFDVLQRDTPALILMDIQLPVVDGWELTRQLKADPATSHIPVIAITAYGQYGDESKAQQAGFAEFLTKPVSTRQLPAIIRRHLSAR